jgi:hypothetical protein
MVQCGSPSGEEIAGVKEKNVVEKRDCGVLAGIVNGKRERGKGQEGERGRGERGKRERGEGEGYTHANEGSR